MQVLPGHPLADPKSRSSRKYVPKSRKSRGIQLHYIQPKITRNQLEERRFACARTYGVPYAAREAKWLALTLKGQP